MGSSASGGCLHWAPWGRGREVINFTQGDIRLWIPPQEQVMYENLGQALG